MNPLSTPQQSLHSGVDGHTIVHPLSTDITFFDFNQVDYNQLLGPEIKPLFGSSTIDDNQFQYCSLEELFPSDILLNISGWGWDATTTTPSSQQQPLYQPQQWVGQDAQSQLVTSLVPILPPQELIPSNISDSYTQFLGYLPSPEGSPSCVSSQGFYETFDSSRKDYDIDYEIDTILKVNYDRKATTNDPHLATLSMTEEYETDNLSSDGQGNVVSTTKRKRRPRKSCEAESNFKSIKLTLRCPREGCKVTCSSYPSLARHLDSHKWRGRYQPLRCEACHNGLSNEYAVQRHILRSDESMRCRSMSVYSFMKSKTEIETTVKFYPGRAHGKKTVIVNLDDMKSIYFGQL
ncbi:hypothetical protein BGZ76_000422 [Entomortierella beljakovae]|nr:hypothetical protein BGZ76_000422 [Entomortierella beljakovae]